MPSITSRSQSGFPALAVSLVLVTPFLVGFESSSPETRPQATVAADPNDDAIAWQMLTVEYRTELLELAYSHANFTSSILTPEAQTLTIQGTGDAPSDVQQKMDAAPVDIEVSWLTVPYSADQLASEAMDAMAADSTLSAISFRSDGSGLIVDRLTVPDNATQRSQVKDDLGLDVPATLRDRDYDVPTDGRAEGQLHSMEVRGWRETHLTQGVQPLPRRSRTLVIASC